MAPARAGDWRCGSANGLAVHHVFPIQSDHQPERPSHGRMAGTEIDHQGPVWVPSCIMGRSQWQDLEVCCQRASTLHLMLCLPKPTQRLPRGKPCLQAFPGTAPPALWPPFSQSKDGTPRVPWPCPASGASATGYSSILHNKVLMAMLDFQDRELRSAFENFSKISQSRSQPIQIDKRLLLYAIYAVECGLKYLLLRKYRRTRTKDIL